MPLYVSQHIPRDFFFPASLEKKLINITLLARAEHVKYFTVLVVSTSDTTTSSSRAPELE